MQRKPRAKEEPTPPATNRPKGPAVRTSGTASKTERERAEAPTLPPPRLLPDERISQPPPAESKDKRTSGIRSRRAEQKPPAAATVDEVVADLSKDPRRERDDYNDDDQ